MICFYHADNDGKCAGFWVNKCGLTDKYGKTFFKIDDDDIQTLDKLFNF